MKVAGIDLALGITGVAWPDGSLGRISTVKSTDTLPARLRYIAGEFIRSLDADVVALEDLPSARLAGAGSAVGVLGMVHGAVRCALDQLLEYGRIRGVVLIQPSQLKKYATGKGNANKAEVLVEAVKRLGYTGADNNEADAMWLRAMTLDHYGAPLATMPAAHRVALETVEWPTLEVA